MLLPFEANTDTDAVAHHTLPRKLPLMPHTTNLSYISLPAEATIDADARQKIMMFAPADVIINAVARQGNHRSRHPLKLSKMPSSAGAIINVVASWSFYHCPLKLSWLPSISPIIEAPISVQFNNLQTISSYSMSLGDVPRGSIS